MSFIFGDSFDLYAAVADPLAGYWDGGSFSGVNVAQFTPGRFTGSQAITPVSAGATVAVWLYKNSGSNDPVHHIVCAFQQTAALSGSTANMYFQLCDGATGQCCVVFRTDGAVLLTSGGPTGTTLATYSGAVTATNTWFAFEFEVVINNTTGSFTARKNGNTSNDFTLGSLNTRGGTANNYANRLQIGNNSNVGGTSQKLDDVLWRSDAASVAWVGDTRSYTRMPATDASTQFARAPSPYVQTVFTTASTTANTAGTARYTSFTAAYDGTIAAATVSFGTGYTGNLKCSLFASSGSVPTTVLGSANVLTNPIAGSNALTFGTPVAVVKGAQYWIGFDSDTSSGTLNATGVAGLSSATAYASFPTASPGTSAGAASVTSTVTITPTTNYQMVNETLQDGTTTYVYDSTAGHADFYNIAALTPQPATTIAVTTRGFIEKSDAGTRTGTVQLKSGGTTVAAPTVTLSTSFAWAWRTDVLNPNGSVAWTAGAVDSCTIGPSVVS